MRARMALVVTVTTAVIATPSLAAPGKPPVEAEVLKGGLGPMPHGAERAQVLAKFRGFVRLVDGEGRDRVSVRVRGLNRKTAYLWHVHAVKATKAPEPCAHHVPHPLAAGFKKYPLLETNRRGRARAIATGRRFKAKASKTYYVHVDRASDGISVGCGVLAPVAPKPPEPSQEPAP